MSDKKFKTRNPSNGISSNEIIRFRGVIGGENEQMIPEEYVESCDNLESFKLREMTPRIGSTLKTTRDAGITAGRRTLSQVVTVAGTNVYSDPIRNNLTPVERPPFIPPVTNPNIGTKALAGFVFDIALTGVSGATIDLRVVPGGAIIATTTTAGDGSFSIIGLSHDYHHVTVTASGYTTQELVLPSNLTASVTLESAGGYSSVWRTTSGSEEIRIGIVNVSGVNYNCAIDWGDGSGTENFVLTGTGGGQEYIPHTYTSSGDHAVTITGTFPRQYFEQYDATAITYASKLISVSNLGLVGWTYLGYSFCQCANMTSFVAGETDTSAVSGISSMFDMAGVAPVGLSLDMSGMDLSNVGDWQEYVFFNADISSFISPDSFNAEYCYTWLNGNTALTAIDFTNWDFSGVNDSFAFNNFCTDVPLDSDSYDQLLIKLESENAETGVTLDADLCKYSTASASARASLISRSWSITDAGAV